MGLLPLLFKDPGSFVILVGLLLYSVIFHEVAHGVVAYWFGDRTARDAGRLTLNPVVHIDPMGTIMLFLVGFGWANPVPVNFYNLKHYRAGLICVALAGCLTNIAIATVALFILQFYGTHSFFSGILLIVARINIILGAFNLIPIPPLDGSKILMGFLPADMQMQLARFERYGFIILIVLLFTRMLDPVIYFMMDLILKVISLIIGVV